MTESVNAAVCAAAIQHDLPMFVPVVVPIVGVAAILALTYLDWLRPILARYVWRHYR